MTEKEAHERCAELAAHSPERFTHSWVPREGDQGWTIVKLAVPAATSPPITTTNPDRPQEAQEDPPLTGDQEHRSGRFRPLAFRGWPGAPPKFAGRRLDGRSHVHELTHP
jgi:hypothetical protein